MNNKSKVYPYDYFIKIINNQDGNGYGPTSVGGKILMGIIFIPIMIGYKIRDGYVKVKTKLSRSRCDKCKHIYDYSEGQRKVYCIKHDTYFKKNHKCDLFIRKR